MSLAPAQNLDTLAADIKALGPEHGFQKVGIADIDLDTDRERLDRWLELERHGEMHYMQKHGDMRSHPEQLVPGTVRVISARMNYWPRASADARAELGDARRAYVARYAVGRDYHKLMRKRLKAYAESIEQRVGPMGYRVFVDSAPVLERALARNAGLGWIGKHTNLLDRNAGSWFFLGEIFTDVPLPPDAPVTEHCGSCRACIDVCPTGAIVAPYELDARRCISYLTIELKGSIPEALRPAIGNRIFGCDDCQLFCPWNKFAQTASEDDFTPRHGLDSATLVELFGWSEDEWSERTAGSAIRRAGYEGWLRNIAVALGNAPTEPEIVDALRTRANHASAMVREHVEWALERHAAAAPGSPPAGPNRADPPPESALR